jgi:hypothetical protein
MTTPRREYDIEIIRGDTDVHRITVEKLDESIKDITGATVKYTIRENNANGTQVLQATTENEKVILLDPTNGKLQRTFTYADTEVLNPKKRYVYDVELTILMERHTVQRGKVIVIADISRAA